jgi:hypothetical protein
LNNGTTEASIAESTANTTGQTRMRNEKNRKETQKNKLCLTGAWKTTCRKLQDTDETLSKRERE